MPRPRNDKLKEQIATESWRQFRAHGYNGTTYSTIAKKCGISRNLVQYHFPKKELLASGFMEHVLAEAQAALGLSDQALFNDFPSIYEVGCCFFLFLMQKGGYRQFLSDTVSSRELTQDTLAFDLEWALDRLELPEDIDLEPVRQEVIVSMGGFYELMYYCLKADKPFPVEERLAKVVDGFAKTILKATGAEQKEPAIADTLDGETRGRLQDAVKKMNRVFDSL
ncbi:MAG: TetR/AcrR family transcriptional regulator [Coriobacteriales bacterium]|jgi:AcrR family transcriptional regulator